MPKQILNTTDINITTYSLYDFLQEVQEVIIEGYRFDFESNEAYPQQIGSVFTAILKKPSVEFKSKVVPNPLASIKNPTKAVLELSNGITDTEDKPVGANTQKQRGRPKQT
jgi:hypothetical protein